MTQEQAQHATELARRMKQTSTGEGIRAMPNVRLVDLIDNTIHEVGDEVAKSLLVAERFVLHDPNNPEHPNEDGTPKEAAPETPAAQPVVAPKAKAVDLPTTAIVNEPASEERLPNES